MTLHSPPVWTSRSAVCRLAHVVATAIISGWLGFANAAAKETPRLIKSGEISLSRWCGDHAVIGYERSEGLLWLDLRSGKQINLSLALPAWKPDEEPRAISVTECSPDGRWVLGDYYHFRDGDSACDRYHDQPPPIV